ncbi:hypothetical protein L208DRAFT_1557149 [Tricholoma matsutake]|nr:hypothetical protein L208DRAFT_1557149 [Tricholoma matsutake 945]
MPMLLLMPMPLPSTMYAISDLYIINILHSVSQARIVKVYSFDTSTCYTYYESIQQCPPNPYHSVHCMHSIDHIIQYSVAYLYVSDVTTTKKGSV